MLNIYSLTYILHASSNILKTGIFVLKNIIKNAVKMSMIKKRFKYMGFNNKLLGL